MPKQTIKSKLIDTTGRGQSFVTSSGEYFFTSNGSDGTIKLNSVSKTGNYKDLSLPLYGAKMDDKSARSIVPLFGDSKVILESKESIFNAYAQFGANPLSHPQNLLFYPVKKFTRNSATLWQVNGNFVVPHHKDSSSSGVSYSIGLVRFFEREASTTNYVISDRNTTTGDMKFDLSGLNAVIYTQNFLKEFSTNPIPVIMFVLKPYIVYSSDYGSVVEAPQGIYWCLFLNVTNVSGDTYNADYTIHTDLKPGHIAIDQPGYPHLAVFNSGTYQVDVNLESLKSDVKEYNNISLTFSFDMWGEPTPDSYFEYTVNDVNHKVYYSDLPQGEHQVKVILDNVKTLSWGACFYGLDEDIAHQYYYRVIRGTNRDDELGRKWYDEHGGVPQTQDISSQLRDCCIIYVGITTDD